MTEHAPLQAWWATAPLSGAIGILQIEGDAASLLRTLSGISVPVGGSRLADLASFDEGLVIRPTETSTFIMPHGGPQIRRLLTRAVADAGVTIIEPTKASVRSRWPETSTLVEACLLDVLARTASPRAIDLLLDQPEIHRKAAAAGWTPGEEDRRHARRLEGLIDPPLIAIVGAPNVGKSSLLNRLAGRDVAITADHEGTTRDAVTARVELDGVACILVDLPGERSSDDPIEQRAIELGRRFLEEADLLVALAEPGRTEPPTLARTPDLTVINKSDTVADAGERAISVRTGVGIEALVQEMRNRLVPDGALAERERPWCFHPALFEPGSGEDGRSD